MAASAPMGGGNATISGGGDDMVITYASGGAGGGGVLQAQDGRLARFGNAQGDGEEVEYLSPLQANPGEEAPCVRRVVVRLGPRNEGARVIESGSIRTSIQEPHRRAAAAAGERGD
jgi:hypothetical protein